MPKSPHQNPFLRFLLACLFLFVVMESHATKPPKRNARAKRTLTIVIRTLAVVSQSMTPSASAPPVAKRATTLPAKMPARVLEATSRQNASDLIHSPTHVRFWVGSGVSAVMLRDYRQTVLRGPSFHFGTRSGFGFTHTPCVCNPTPNSFLRIGQPSK